MRGSTVDVRAWILSERTGQPIEIAAHLGGIKGGTLEIGFDPVTGRISVFGLRRLDVWVEIRIFAV